MRTIQATKVVKDQLVEEHEQLVSEMRELSSELRDCIEEMRKAISLTELRGCSRTNLRN
jgi:hypothetical protein